MRISTVAHYKELNRAVLLDEEYSALVQFFDYNNAFDYDYVIEWCGVLFIQKRIEC